MSKKVIAVDIDDVLAANAKGFIAYSNEQWGTTLTMADYQEHWGQMWGIEEAEIAERGAIFHDSGVMASYEHYQEAYEVLKSLSKGYELVCATSRRLIVQDLTREWVQRCFPDVFSKIYFAGIYDNAITHDTFSATKADILRNINADYLIDDQLKHCLAAAKIGCKAVLFGDYAWNKADSLPSGVTRCHDWIAVKEYFDGQR